MLDIAPILKTLWRRPTGPLLIILQLALSIAIVSNALSFITQRYAYIARDPGIQISGLLTFNVQQDSSKGELEETVIKDLEYLRSLNSVKSAGALTGVPMGHSGGTTRLSTEPESEGKSSMTAVSTSASMLRVGNGALTALEMRLAEGRNFNSGEYLHYKRGDIPEAGSIMMTRSLAKSLFPNEASAVGKIIYESGYKAYTVVGIVDDMFGHILEWDFPRHVIIFPWLEMESGINYIVRVDDKNKELIQADIVKGLRGFNNARIIDAGKTMEDVQRNAYAGDHAMIKLLSVMLILLVGVNALGIVGLTSFWVAQRRKQIGIRRALGATRVSIMRYFLIENVFIVLVSSCIGAIAAIVASVYMVKAYSFAPLPWVFIPIAGGVVLFITLGASIAPVRRASYISPVEAVSGN